MANYGFNIDTEYGTNLIDWANARQEQIDKEREQTKQDYMNALRMFGSVIPLSRMHGKKEYMKSWPKMNGYEEELLTQSQPTSKYSPDYASLVMLGINPEMKVR